MFFLKKRRVSQPYCHLHWISCSIRSTWWKMWISAWSSGEESWHRNPSKIDCELMKDEGTEIRDAELQDMDTIDWTVCLTSLSESRNSPYPCQYHLRENQSRLHWPSALGLWNSTLVLLSWLTKYNWYIVNHLFYCLSLRKKTHKQKVKSKLN